MRNDLYRFRHLNTIGPQWVALFREVGGVALLKEVSLRYVTPVHALLDACR